VTGSHPSASPGWRGFLAIARSGVASARLHALRSAATVACATAVLAPFVAGLALSGGIAEQAAESLRGGADLYVTGTRLGREAPVPLEAETTLRAIPGVKDVVPRIVGEVSLGRESVPTVVVGLPPGRLPVASALLRGRAFAPGLSREAVIGSGLSSRLGLDVGAKIPPFYRNEAGERVTTVTGVLDASAPLWHRHVLFTSIETASEVFAQKGLATQFLVDVTPGYAEAVRSAILRLDALGPDDGHGPMRASVAARGDLEARLSRGLVRREGVFALHFVLLFAAGIPLVLVASGIGLSERRREVGLLKAIGWQTDEVVVRVLVESLLLTVVAASLAILVAFTWLRVFAGAGLVAVFLPGLEGGDVVPPYALAPGPVLAGAAAAFAIVALGSLLAAWRSARAAPAEAMR